MRGFVLDGDVQITGVAGVGRAYEFAGDMISLRYGQRIRSVKHSLSGSRVSGSSKKRRLRSLTSNVCTWHEDQ